METYIPLYRKYRPQQFSDLIGQDMVSTAVGNALTLNRIAHAYLFCGPRGTGKTSSARIFAKSLNCINGPTPTPCQVCPSCTAITNGTALDVTEIDAASNNGVDSIRELTDKVQFSPMQGKFKVYIIDEVHMLSTAAFNALLKTLEEPPPNVVFVFATTEAHKVLPTIISRCQRFDFSRITRDQIAARLSHVAERESIRIAPDAVQLIARHVKGGMRDALGLLDQVSVLGHADDGHGIQVEDIRAFIGMLEEETLFALTDALIARDISGILSQIAALEEKGIEPPRMTQALIQHFRNLMLAQACGANASAVELDLSPENYPALWQQSQQFAPEELPQILSRLSLLENQLRHTPQPQLWFEVMLLELANRENIHKLQTLSDRIAALEAGIMPVKAAPGMPVAAVAQPNNPKPAPPQGLVPHINTPEPVPFIPPVSQQPAATPRQDTASAAPEPIAVAIGDHGALWHQILEHIKQPTRSLLKDYFSLVSISDTHLEIGYAKQAMFDIFNRTPEKRLGLESAVQQITGRAYALTFQLATPLPVTTAASSSPPATAASIAVEQSTPAVSSANAALTSASTLSNPSSLAPLSGFAQALEPTATADLDPFEMAQAKKFTQALLQGKVVE